MQEEFLYQIIANELNLKLIQVRNTVEMLDDDNTVPFISRYRKERTGSLDEDQIRAVESRMKYLRTLDERKITVLKSIEEQGKLTPELDNRIDVEASDDPAGHLDDVGLRRFALYFHGRPCRRIAQTSGPRRRQVHPLQDDGTALG